MTAPSGTGITGIDHVLVGVRDLEAARQAWTRLGFTLSPRGRHIGWGTANYGIMFERGYIGLLGILDPRQFTNRLDEFLKTREGLMGLALASDDAVHTAAALAERGLGPAEPSDLARQLELPEGTVLPRFKIVHLPPGTTPALATYICQPLNPELIRRPAWLDHANGAIGLGGVTVVVPDTAALVQPYEALFGPARVNTTDDIVTVHVGAAGADGHRLVFCTPDDFLTMHPEAELDLSIELPFVALVTVRSGDLARTGDHLASWQVDHEETLDGRLLVPGAAATGAMIEFTQ